MDNITISYVILVYLVVGFFSTAGMIEFIKKDNQKTGFIAYLIGTLVAPISLLMLIFNIVMYFIDNEQKKKH